MLDELLEGADETPIDDARWHEAMATLEKEDERVFVAVILGTPRNFVYWNWRFAYSVENDALGKVHEQFASDVARRTVADAEHAAARYGTERVIVDTKTSGKNPPTETMTP